MSEWLAAALLGLVEGLTEFLPVSSTGHLVLLVDLLNFQAPPGKTFEIVVQLGAVAAVCALYRRRLWQAATGMMFVPRERLFVRNLLLAFFPAMIAGPLVYPCVKRLLDSPLLVSAMLVVGGIAILAIERAVKTPRRFGIESLSIRLSSAIGLFQIIAMIPGVSRSGATIMGALLAGVERRTAAEFSFFLAIPTMLGATLFTLYKNWSDLDFNNLGLIAVGFGVAFLTALFVVQAAVGFIGRHGFTVFAWYRIVLGLIMGTLLLSGG